jgi:hypothetical protein
MARKLKVYRARLGFFDSVVEAGSQTAALRAWGTRQNLFANGEAEVATDNVDIAAALAHPQTPLRRPVGSDGPFELEPRGLPKVPAAPKAKAAATKTARASAPAAPKPRPPDRSKLDAAEQALEALDARHDAEEDDFGREAAALAARRKAAQADHLAARKAAKARIADARAAYRRAGGD